MALDGPTPPPCDAEVFQDGTVVLLTHGIRSNAMERWVKKLAEASGQRVDWHFAGGRAVVKALGDLPKVEAALSALKAEHDRLQAENWPELASGSETETVR